MCWLKKILRKVTSRKAEITPFHKNPFIHKSTKESNAFNFYKKSPRIK